MKNRISSIWPGIVLLLAAIFVSCKDDWDSHFDRSENLPDENLWEIIRSEASLASFGSDRVRLSADLYADIYRLGPGK